MTTTATLSEAAPASLTKEIALQKIQEVLKEILNLENAASLQPSARFREDLHTDSLAMVDIIIGFEEAFGIKMRSDINFFERVQTIDDAAALVVELKSGKA